MTIDSPFTEITVAQDTVACRIDVWLAGQIVDLSRRRAAAMLEAGEVRINGRTAAKSALVHPGDRITLRLEPHTGHWQAIPSPDAPLHILFEDDALIAVAKPSGLPSVPLHRDDAPTLAGAIAAEYPECAALGRRDGDTGLIGRLDTETSGLLIAARTKTAFDQLMKLQREEKIVKSYLALTRPQSPLPRIIRAPLASCGRNAHRVKISTDGEDAVTQLETVSSGTFTLVRAIIIKGFRHQIRVHLASVGAPIAGDTLYDGPAVPGLNRLFLHSAEVSLPHPITGKKLQIACPLSDDLEAVLAAIK